MAQATSSTRVFRILTCAFFLIQRVRAYEFKVGGSTGWTLPNDHNSSVYNQWAEKTRFQIGDTLLFVYAAGQDSVLQVIRDNYANCDVGAPLAKFADGHTTIGLNQSGPHYFISGVADNCRRNEKLVVVVMADRGGNSSNRTAPTPTPMPSPLPPPSPAPSGEESPSPPPPEGETNPTPAPSQESNPPRNSASSVVAGVVGTIVAGFFGSSLVFCI